MPATRLRAEGTSNGGDVRLRRAAIRNIIRTQRVGTQEELRELLEAEGYDVTQATLSRDLAQLGARRVSLPEGGTAYEVDESRVLDEPATLLALGSMVTSVVPTDTLVIVHTHTSTAPAIALALDRARLPEIAGTIAGDDTIFVAPARGVTPKKIAMRLRDFWTGAVE